MFTVEIKLFHLYPFIPVISPKKKDENIIINYIYKRILDKSLKKKKLQIKLINILRKIKKKEFPVE